MTRAAWLVTLLLILSGCTTIQFVRKDFTPEKKAVVRYPPQSKPGNEAKYRDELVKQAREFCGGPFQITREYQQLVESGDAALSTGVGFGGYGYGHQPGSSIFLGGSAPSAVNRHFVEFTCTRHPDAPAAN